MIHLKADFDVSHADEIERAYDLTIPKGDMDLERQVERRRRINAEGDAIFDRRRDSMSRGELSRATRARAQAVAELDRLEGELRDSRSRPNTRGTGRRVWVPGFYRRVRGRRSWVPGYWRTRSSEIRR